jgi:predicted nucleotidyltransferase
MLKLIAWNEKYPERAKDAQDIRYIMQHYIDAGNADRLDSEDSDLRKEKDFDYEKASARILGRDIAKIAIDEAVSLLLEILKRETDSNLEFHLITDMLREGGLFEDYFEPTRTLLLQLKLGITEHRKV